MVAEIAIKQKLHAMCMTSWRHRAGAGSYLVLRQDLYEAIGVLPACVVLGGHGVVRDTDGLGGILDAEADVCPTICRVHPQRACDAAENAGVHVQAARHLTRRHVAHLQTPFDVVSQN